MSPCCFSLLDGFSPRSVNDNRALFRDMTALFSSHVFALTAPSAKLKNGGDEAVVENKTQRAKRMA
jgi:hypothetical protein